MSKLKPWGLVASLLIPLILIYWRWFFTLDVFTYGDWWWYFRDTATSWLSIPQVWLHSGFGSVDIGLSQYLIVKLLYPVLSLFWDFPMFDRFVFLLPSVIFPALSSYYLAKKILKENVGVLASVLVFSLNTYLLTIRTGHLTLAVAFGIAPIVIALFIETLHEQNIRKALLCGLTGYVCFSYEPRAYYLTAGIMAFYMLFYLIQYRPSLKHWQRLVRLSLLPFLLVLFLCLYGIIGLVVASKELTDTILTRSLFGAGNVNIQRGYAIFVNNWPEFLKNIKTYYGFSIYFWITPISAFIGLWLGRKSRNIVFFGLVAMLGVFFVKLTNQPFGQIYPWLYNHVPGFNAFRESSKFYFLISLGFSILIGNLVNVFWSYLRYTKLRYIKFIVIGLILFPYILNGITIFSGKHSELLTPRFVPNDYLIYKEFIKHNYGEYRTLFIPEQSRWAYWNQNIRIISATNLSLIKFPEIADYHKLGLEYSGIDNLLQIFEKNDSDDLLDKLSVKYVVIPPEDLENDEKFIFSWGLRETYLDRISKLTHLKKLEIGTKDLVVYENTDFYPIFYWTQRDEIGQRQDVSGRVGVRYVSPTQIELVVQDIPYGLNHLQINFTETYHSGWHLFIGPFDWLKTLVIKNNNFYQHKRSYLKTNQFELNPQSILKKYPTIASPKPDGAGYDLKFTLYFAPQIWVNVGSIISVITLIGSIFALIVTFKQKND